MPTPTKDALIARVGFNTPSLDGKGELRFEIGDKVPDKALTDKTQSSLVRQGVIAADGDDAPELGWSQGRAIVDGVEVTS